MMTDESKSPDKQFNINMFLFTRLKLKCDCALVNIKGWCTADIRCLTFRAKVLCERKTFLSDVKLRIQYIGSTPRVLKGSPRVHQGSPGSSRRPWSCIFRDWSRLGLKMYIFLTLEFILSFC